MYFFYYPPYYWYEYYYYKRPTYGCYECYDDDDDYRDKAEYKVQPELDDSKYSPLMSTGCIYYWPITAMPCPFCSILYPSTQETD